MNTKDGGPAFPEVFTDHDYDASNDTMYPNTYSVGGMTLRDFFAAKAMQGMAACPDGPTFKSQEEATAWLAGHAYAIADAMLAAREAKA